MPSTVAGFAEVRDRLRARGFTVTEVPGWETRGSGTLTPRGFVWHHTASPGTGRTRSLRLCTNGREGLRNALCNWYCAVDGEQFLVAARTAWHAGSGGWRGVSGNSSVIGEEWESDGTSQRATVEADASMLALAVECGDVFGFDAGAHCEHAEWTPRKVDRYGYHGPSWRSRIQSGVTDSTPVPPPQPKESEVVYAIMADGSKHLMYVSGPLQGLLTQPSKAPEGLPTVHFGDAGTGDCYRRNTEVRREMRW